MHMYLHMHCNCYKHKSATLFWVAAGCVQAWRREYDMDGLLEGVSCDSQTSALAASIVGKEILLHNGPDGSGRPPESFLALFTG